MLSCKLPSTTLLQASSLTTVSPGGRGLHKACRVACLLNLSLREQRLESRILRHFPVFLLVSRARLCSGAGNAAIQQRPIIITAAASKNGATPMETVNQLRQITTALTSLDYAYESVDEMSDIEDSHCDSQELDTDSSPVSVAGRAIYEVWCQEDTCKHSYSVHCCFTFSHK